MAKSDKHSLPAYISYSFFTNFINGLRETHIPLQIDRTVMSKASGSQISAMIVSLRFLKLTDENNKPTPLLKQLVEASDADRGAVLLRVMNGAYGFVLNETFDLEKATGQLVADKFREQGISGATMTKAMGFFLACAKDAGIKVSPHIKPPAPPPPRNEVKRMPRRRQDQDDYDETQEEETSSDEDMIRFELPIPGKRNAIVTVPNDLSSDDWDMLTKMLDLYIKRLQTQAG